MQLFYYDCAPFGAVRFCLNASTIDDDAAMKDKANFMFMPLPMKLARARPACAQSIHTPTGDETQEPISRYKPKLWPWTFRLSLNN